MRVPVRVHRSRGAVDAELPVCVRREVADRVDRDPELERDHLVRHASRLALERRALSGGQWPRVRGRRSPHGSTHSPTPVVPHGSTRWPTGAERCQGAYCAHPGQAPPHRGTRAASRRSRHHVRQRSSRARERLMRRPSGAGGGTSGGIGLRSSRSVRAEMPDLLRRGRDSNP
jgi:hypothetical protein